MLLFLRRWLSGRSSSPSVFSHSAAVAASGGFSRSRQSPPASSESGFVAAGPRRRLGCPCFDSEHAAHCGSASSNAEGREGSDVASLAQRVGVSQKALRSLSLVFSSSWESAGCRSELAVFSRKQTLYALFLREGEAAEPDGLQCVSARSLLARFSREPISVALESSLAPYARAGQAFSEREPIDPALASAPDDGSAALLARKKSSFAA